MNMEMEAAGTRAGLTGDPSHRRGDPGGQRDAGTRRETLLMELQGSLQCVKTSPGADGSVRSIFVTARDQWGEVWGVHSRDTHSHSPARVPTHTHTHTHTLTHIEPHS